MLWDMLHTDIPAEGGQETNYGTLTYLLEVVKKHARGH